MNAMCEVERKPINSVRSQQVLFTRTGARSVEQGRCPHCDSIIYSRRHKLCGVCGLELPDRCRFDAGQAEQVSAILKEEKLRHRAWMTRYSMAN